MFVKLNHRRFVMVRRGDVYGLMVEHFAKQGQYKQVAHTNVLNISIASSVIMITNKKLCTTLS